MPPTAVRLTASYEMRDDGWMATARRKGVTIAAHGRTLEKARQNLVSELANKLDVYAGQIALDDDVAVDASAIAAVDAARSARDEALRATAESNAATLAAARALDAAGLSLRDVAYLLGVSHSRVHQILGKHDTKGTSAR